MRAILLIPMILILTACGPQSEIALEWPTLTTLDLAVEELDGLLKQDAATDKLAEHVTEVASSLEAVVKGGIPPGAKNPELVEQKLAELSSLQPEILTASTTGNQEALHALHPLVASIMETAGMPHVHSCANCASCSGDHGQKPHDHAHGEHQHEGHDHHDH